MSRSEHDWVNEHMVAYAMALKLIERGRKLTEERRFEEGRVELLKAAEWAQKCQELEAAVKKDRP